MPATVSLIRDQLRQAILQAELTPGEPATQAELADRLGVSRTPLREALRMLELEGLVQRESSGRFRISPLSFEQIEELSVMRIELEAVAVRLTVPTLEAADHAALEGRLAQIERYAMLGDWVGLEVPHREFHRALVAGGGDQITSLIAQLWNHATRYRKVAFQQASNNGDRWEISKREHRAIVDAVEAYDADTAALWAVTQIARSALGVAREIDPDRPVLRLRAAFERHGVSIEP